MVENLKGETVLVLGAGVVGALVLYSMREKLNPFSPENIASKGAESFYKYTTGSKGSMGADFYEFVHAPDSVLRKVDPTSSRNMAYEAANSSWRAVGVLGEHDTIGTKVYDGVQWIKSFF